MVPSAAFYEATDTVHLTGENFSNTINIRCVQSFNDLLVYDQEPYLLSCLYKWIQNFKGILVGLQSAHITNLWVRTVSD